MTHEPGGFLAQPSEAKELPRKGKVRDYIEVFGLTVLVALFLKTFVVEAYQIPTGSMENTILVGDFLLVNKFIYGARTPSYIPFTGIKLPYMTFPAITEPQRGDVVVFEYPGNLDEGMHQGTTEFVKRCIGIPGDTVKIIDKRVYVNSQEFALPPGAKLDRENIRPKGFRDYGVYPIGAPFNGDNYGPVVLPKAGDALSFDEKDIYVWEKLIGREGHIVSYAQGGPVYIDGVSAKTYRVDKDYYFMLGDNRDNSLDSRFWGYVPRDLIIGKALAIYWSSEDSVASDSWFEKLLSVRLRRIGTLVR